MWILFLGQHYVIRYRSWIYWRDGAYSRPWWSLKVGRYCYTFLHFKDIFYKNCYFLYIRSKFLFFRLIKYINGLTEKDLDVVIDTLFDACGPAQRWKLQQRLPELLFRDFFKDLPAELLDKVLRYLDAPNLLNCLKVSKVWNQRLLANENLWKVR